MQGYDLMDVRSHVAIYRQRGWYCVPVRPRSKSPARRDWTNLRLAPEVFPDNSNVGIILGAPSGWLVDVDLDCAEAIELADQYLPPTPAITGRPSSPGSHRWYIATEATTQKHTDPNDGAMIVELRSTGAQTVVGPSVHPDGEPYDVLSAEPAIVPAPMLSACVKALADAVIVKRSLTIAKTNAPVLRVPGFINEVMDHCLETAPYPNPVMAFCGALALQATLAGRRVGDPGDNRTNLYLLGLAHSAAGKDWPRKLNIKILQKIGMADCTGERFASGEGIQDSLNMTPSMLFQTDEIDGLLQAIKKSTDARYEQIMSTLLTMYSSANSVYRIISSPHLSDSYYQGSSGSAWYLFANPNVLPAFEIVFLNGRRTPVIERVEMPPNTLGMGFRSYIDFGVNSQDPRAAVKVTGE